MPIPGYNCERPTQENYDGFVTEFTRGLEDLKIEGLSLMLYGSYLRPQDFNPGRSDLDAVLVFPDNVVIDKINLHRASAVLSNALRNNLITFQVSVTDLATMIDGRFNSFLPNFERYFLRETRTYFHDYTPRFNYMMPTDPEQIPLVFNLRKTRQGLLFAQYDLKTDYENFLGKFVKSLDGISRGSKQIISLLTQDFPFYRFSVLDSLEEHFPHVDIRVLAEIKRLYKDADQLDTLYQNPDEVLRLWNDATTFMEKLVKAYIEKVPNSGK